jgi:hypothetical protein
MDTPEVLNRFPDYAGKPFYPSNGMEGMIFMEAFCEQCIHERWIHCQEEDRDEDKCKILSASMINQPGDPEYPKEWVYNEKGWPVCTAWKRWDWGSDGDGFNEPPEPPYEPQDPNQLMLFSIADDILQNHTINPKTLQHEKL